MKPVFQVSNEQKLQHIAPRLERIFSLLSSVFERFVITTFLISDRATSSNGPFSWDCTSSVILGFHMTFPKFQRGIIAPKHLYLYEFSARKVSSLWVENGTDFFRFCYHNIPCPRINITLIFMSFSSDEFTNCRKTQLLVSSGHICAPQRDTNMASPYNAFSIWVKRFSEYLAYARKVISFYPFSGYKSEINSK